MPFVLVSIINVLSGIVIGYFIGKAVVLKKLHAFMQNLSNELDKAIKNVNSKHDIQKETKEN